MAEINYLVSLQKKNFLVSRRSLSVEINVKSGSENDRQNTNGKL